MESFRARRVCNPLFFSNPLYFPSPTLLLVEYITSFLKDSIMLRIKMVRQKLKKGFIILKNSTLELLIPPLKRIGNSHSRILSVSLVPLIISLPIMVGQWWYNCSSRRPFCGWVTCTTSEITSKISTWILVQISNGYYI